MRHSGRCSWEGMHFVCQDEGESAKKERPKAETKGDVAKAMMREAADGGAVADGKAKGRCWPEVTGRRRWTVRRWAEVEDKR